MENNQDNLNNSSENLAPQPQPSATIRRDNGQMAVKKEYEEKLRQHEYNTPVGVQYRRDLRSRLGQAEKYIRQANQIEGSAEGAE